MAKQYDFRKLINDAQKRLCKKKPCENFGQKDVRRLHDLNDTHFPPYSREWNENDALIQDFDEWCMTYSTYEAK